MLRDRYQIQMYLIGTNLERQLASTNKDNIDALYGVCMWLALYTIEDRLSMTRPRDVQVIPRGEKSVIRKES